MRVAGFVGVAMVAAVRGHPEQQRPFQGHGAGDHQHAFEESGRLERLVGEVAMESDCDAEHLNRVERDEKCVVEQGGPAGEHQIQRDAEADGGYSDRHQGDDALGARASGVELENRAGERFFSGRRCGRRISGCECHARSLLSSGDASM